MEKKIDIERTLVIRRSSGRSSGGGEFGNVAAWFAIGVVVSLVIKAIFM